MKRWASRSCPRLNLFARHLAPLTTSLKSTVELNTPFSIERSFGVLVDDSAIGATELGLKKLAEPSTKSDKHKSFSTAAKMAFQEEHATLLVPGPVENEDAVLQAMGHYRCAASACAT
jgi:alanine-glyoxylate transaminase/serine-glyoxylate transaminase/serine-pyruvate transaminase